MNLGSEILILHKNYETQLRKILFIKKAASNENLLVGSATNEHY
jgi:hypothetical protein